MAEEPYEVADQQPLEVNAGYAALQLAKALTTAVDHPDPATRRRAEAKIATWEQVASNILSGSFDYGSRTPVPGAPAWATLEVVTGGFATGDLLAGGPLQPHELALLERFPQVPQSEARRFLNAYYLSEEGLAELQQRLRSGGYQIELPEEGALLVVAWLLEQGLVEEARALLDKLSPFFSQLRFYPLLIDAAPDSGTRVHLQDVKTTIQDLTAIKPNRRILAQREASNVWAPYYDQLVALALETAVDDQPGRQIPDGWKERATKLLGEYAALRRQHQLCGKPDKQNGHFAKLRNLLQQMTTAQLTDAQLGMLALIVRAYVAKRGIPDSQQCRDQRAREQGYVASPLFADVSKVVIERMQVLPHNRGVDDIVPLQRPLDAAEAERFRLPEDCVVPETIRRKVERCLNETVQELIARGLITSGETLARVLPQMTSSVRAAGIADPTLRKLYAAIYRAFRKRRSLLLLNLQKQVQLEELPWITALDRFRRKRVGTSEAAQHTLAEIARIAYQAFPHVILPNKLLQEMRALAKSAGCEIPLVDEVAADIFMGQFSDKFTAAAHIAADMLQDSLYARYYDIDFAQVRKLQKFPGKRRYDSVDELAKYCAKRAGVPNRSWSPATNGMVIEQQQIVTTQNLAACFGQFDLTEQLGDELFELAQNCFRWICRRQQIKIVGWHARLIMIKNTAYAWRQMIFYLSMQPEMIEPFLAWADEHFAAQAEAFQTRFQPAMEGLKLAAAGQALDAAALQKSSAKRFLGWSREKHWLTLQTS